MIVPDVNVLLYAHVDAFLEHDRARTWWEETLSAGRPVGLAPVVVFGFIRIATSRRVLTRPFSVQQAQAVVESWLAQPGVQMLDSGREHLGRTLEVLTGVGTAAALTTDAQIAAHAFIEGAAVATHDTDFGRFADLDVVDPVR